MPDKHPYELDFEEYIRNTEPAKKDKTYAWSTAIGLQQVDGLTPSKYLFDTAKRNIDGEISIDEAKSLLILITNQKQNGLMIQKKEQKKRIKLHPELLKF